jgi:DNA mismatch repair protein MutL
MAFGTYLILEKNDSLFFIDFHAAHERILYDALVEKGRTIEGQRLAFPLVIELSLEDHLLVLENIEKFSEIGFDIEDFSDNSIKITSVPDVARDAEISNIITEFIHSVHDEKGAGAGVDRVAAAVACHAAKRAGDRLSQSDAERLAGLVLNGGIELRCPHGRPYVYRIDKGDIERTFKR